MTARKTYQTPEVVELGSAAKLTLGGPGCRGDGVCCKQTSGGGE